MVQTVNTLDVLSMSNSSDATLRQQAGILVSNQGIIAARANVLTILSLNKSPKIIVTNAQNLIIKVPLPAVFKNSAVTITKGDKLLIEELAFFLVNNGFTRSSSAIDSGEFAISFGW
jgi:transcription-repair coupling factor (superfamily II helicase)